MDRKSLVILGLGFEFIGMVIGTFMIGTWADERYGLRGLGVLVGTLSGVALWLIHFFLSIRALEKKDE